MLFVAVMKLFLVTPRRADGEANFLAQALMGEGERATKQNFSSLASREKGRGLGPTRRHLASLRLPKARLHASKCISGRKIATDECIIIQELDLRDLVILTMSSYHHLPT